MALLGSLAKSLYTALWTMNAMRRMTQLMALKMTETPNPDWLSYNWRSLLAQETFISKRSPWRKVLFDIFTLIFKIEDILVYVWETSSCNWKALVKWSLDSKLSIPTKDQLISKCLFGVFNFFQKTNENTSHSSKNEFIGSFFGGNRWPQKPFRNYLTFNNLKIHLPSKLSPEKANVHGWVIFR